MIKLISVISLLFVFVQTNDLTDKARMNYEKAVNNKAVCESMINQLDNAQQNTLEIGYLGAYQMIWANHTINPINKLKTLNRGRKNLEKAIQKDNNNPELRFLRLSIQKNIPAFLQYSRNIAEDTKFIKEHINKINSSAIKSKIESLLNK